MTDSILNSVKEKVNVGIDNREFDGQLIDHINYAFSTLHGLGIGPIEAFEISDASAKWDDLIRGDARLNGIKTYVGLVVRMVFDPPSTSFTQDAIAKQIAELEWRLNVVREGTVYGAPLYDGGSVGSPTLDTVDGGTP